MAYRLECPLCTRKLQKQADDAVLKLDEVKDGLNLTRNLTVLQEELRATEEFLQGQHVRAILIIV